MRQVAIKTKDGDSFNAVQASPVDMEAALSFALDYVKQVDDAHDGGASLLQHRIRDTLDAIRQGFPIIIK